MKSERGQSLVLVAIFFALLAIAAYVLLSGNTTMLDLYNSVGSVAQSIG